MQKKIENLIGRIKSINKDLDYASLMSYSFSHEFFSDLVKNIQDPKIRKNYKRWAYDIIKNNYGNFREQFCRKDSVESCHLERTHHLVNEQETCETPEVVSYEPLPLNEEFCIDKNVPVDKSECLSFSNDGSRSASNSSSSLPNFNISTEKKHLGVLPKGSVNVCPTDHVKVIRTKYSKCTVEEGEFEITKEQWEKISKGGKLIPCYYPFFFRTLVGTYVNNSCNLAFYRVHYKEYGIIVLAYCRNNNRGCKNFKICITNQYEGTGKCIKVYSTSLNYCHPYKLTGQVRGVERNIVQKSLKKTMPSEYRKITVNISDKEKILRGNLQNIKSDSTLRKIRSEARSTHNYHKDDLVNTFLFAKHHASYIKQVSYPLNIKIFGTEQLNVASSSEENILYFDATGGVVRPQPQQKRVLYYCGLVKLPDNRLCPILEMISSEHNEYTITDFFVRFKKFCKVRRSWPLFEVFVSDFSFASINAASQGFNEMKLSEYLEICFGVFNNNVGSMPRNVIRISLCCAHMIKTMCSVIDEFTDKNEKNIRNMIKSMVAIGFNVQDKIETVLWFKNLSIVLTSKWENDDVTSALTFFRDREQIVTDLEAPVLENESYKKSKHGLRQQSSFYSFFKNIHTNAIHHNDGNIKNKYYNKEVFERILERYMALFPLWSSVINKKRVSNSLIERWFGFLKYNILEGQKNIKPVVFIKKIRSHVKRISKEIQYNIPKNRLASGPKQKNGKSDEEPSEMWNRQKKKRIPFFSGNYLKNIPKSSAQLASAQPVVFLKNNLISDPNYYKNFNDLSYYVGYYPFKAENQFLSAEEFNYFESDNMNKSLIAPKTFDIVSSILSVKYDTFQKQIQIWTLQKTFVKENEPLEKNPEFGNITFIPLFTENEIIIFKIDFINNTFAIYDSSGTISQSASQKYLEQFLNILVHATAIPITGTDWQLVIEEHPTAEGAFEKSVLSIYILDKLIKKSSFENSLPFELTSCCFAIREMLIKYSADVKEFCPLCAKFENVEDILCWTACGKCFRWIHNKCDNRLAHIKQPISSEDFIYYCPLCTRNFDIHPHMKQSVKRSFIFLENGLIADHNYYHVNKDLSNYVIARYEETFTLTVEDYSTLNPDEYLSNTMFKICADLIFSQSGSPFIKIWSIYKTNLLFYELCTLQPAFFKDSFFSDIGSKLNIIPILRNSHFTLFVVDFSKQEFFYIDPKKKSSQNDTDSMMERFVNFIRMLNTYASSKIELGHMRNSLKPHTTQSDFYNCGIYVLHFVQSILRDDDLSSDFDADLSRVELKKMLLEKSLDMRHCCLKCGNLITCFKKVSQCTSCKRYLEKKCQTIGDKCSLCELYEM